MGMDLGCKWTLGQCSGPEQGVIDKAQNAFVIWKRRIPYHVIGFLATTYRFLRIDWSQAGHLHPYLTSRHLVGNIDGRWIRHLTDREALPFSLGLGSSLLLSTLLQFILPVEWTSRHDSKRVFELLPYTNLVPQISMHFANYCNSIYSNTILSQYWNIEIVLIMI